MYKLAEETQNLKDEMAFLMVNLGDLDFEERKNVQAFITELYNNFTEVLEETFVQKKEEIVSGLVGNYA